MFKNNEPYTCENGWTDGKLLKELPTDEQKNVKEWILKGLYPKKTFDTKYDSYILKTILEKQTGIYTTNNQFKDAMVQCGFMPKDPGKLNWTYTIKKTSPALLREKTVIFTGLNVKHRGTIRITDSNVTITDPIRLFKDKITINKIWPGLYDCYMIYQPGKKYNIDAALLVCRKAEHPFPSELILPLLQNSPSGLNGIFDNDYFEHIQLDTEKWMGRIEKTETLDTIDDKCIVSACIHKNECECRISRNALDYITAILMKYNPDIDLKDIENATYDNLG